MAIKRLLICGCARSGNTLMLHLLETGFQNVTKTIDGPGGEVAPTKTIDGKIVVGKFPKKAGKLEKWYSDDLGVVYMMRDPRDVLVSKHYLKQAKYWVQPERWIKTANFALAAKDRDDVELVKYEDLILSPNAVQDRIAERFGLAVLRPFTECHNHFDSNDTANISAMKGARPFDPKRIGNWKGDPDKERRVKNVMKNAELAGLMKKLGY